MESATVYDPVLSDFLYIIDNTIKLSGSAEQNDLMEISASQRVTRKRRLLLNGWQSYGRPSIRQLEAEAMKVVPQKDLALVLPCALKRPYWKSMTHKRVYQKLGELGYHLDDFHRIVITSLGVLPEEVWEMPQVMAYDAGVPDDYRILRLARSYFGKCSYLCVFDCLEFEPYSDVLRIVHREGIIKELRKIGVSGGKSFYIRP